MEPRAIEKNYRKRFASGRNKRGIPNRIDIDQHRVVVNNRERIGDWEATHIVYGWNYPYEETMKEGIMIQGIDYWIFTS